MINLKVIKIDESREILKRRNIGSEKVDIVPDRDSHNCTVVLDNNGRQFSVQAFGEDNVNGFINYLRENYAFEESPYREVERMNWEEVHQNLDSDLRELEPDYEFPALNDLDSSPLDEFNPESEACEKGGKHNLRWVSHRDPNVAHMFCTKCRKHGSCYGWEGYLTEEELERANENADLTDMYGTAYVTEDKIQKYRESKVKHEKKRS